MNQFYKERFAVQNGLYIADSEYSALRSFPTTTVMLALRHRRPYVLDHIEFQFPEPSGLVGANMNAKVISNPGPGSPTKTEPGAAHHRMEPWFRRTAMASTRTCGHASR